MNLRVLCMNVYCDDVTWHVLAQICNNLEKLQAAKSLSLLDLLAPVFSVLSVH